MKRIVFPFLGMLMLWMSGCIKPGENTQCLSYYIPAIYDFSYELDLFQPVFITQGGAFVAQSQSNTELTVGGAYLIAFCVNHDQQPSDKYTTIYNLDMIPSGRGYSQATTDGNSEAGDFDLPIVSMQFTGVVGDIWFFAFEHKESSTQGFVYEMTYDRNKPTDIPVVYCRAKSAQSPSNSTKLGYHAFNMSNFYYDHYDQVDADKKLKFMVRYKIGEEEGIDKYETMYYDGSSTLYMIE